MKKLLRKLTSFAIALFMVLQVMLPAFATRSKAEELEPNTIKNIENLETNEDAYLSITDSQKIYDKKKIDKDESKFSIAVGLPSTSSSFRLVKRNDFKLYEDKFFQTNEDASKEYWRIKDMLNLQGLDLDLEIIKEDQGYKILTKNEMKNLEQGKKDNFYGENYSYIDFKILDDFDFNENGNQKLLNQDKLVFNLEFIKNISPDPNYNLFEQDEQGNWNIKNEGDIFALINEDKKNLYDTNSLTNDLNSLNAYKEERKQAEEEKAQQEAEQKAEEERKAEEEKKQAEQKAKEEEKKKAEEKKAQEEKQKEENANFEKANKELKEALEDKNNSIEDIQKLLTKLGEKYNLSLANQKKLMSSNDKAIKALVEKDRKENFRPLNLAVSNSWGDKVFNLKTQMQVKASDALPIPEGWHFDIKLGPYLKENPKDPVKDLYDNGNLIARATYDQKGHYIRYKFVSKVTTDKTLNIEQNLAFDEESIANKNPITVQIQAAPKNNPVQNAKPITVYKNSQTPVSSNFVIEGEGKTEEGTYPYQLDWKTTSQKLKNKNGEDITNNLAADLSGAFVEWNIEVDTSTLVDKNNKLDFNKLNLTVFGSDKQGLTNISYRFSTNPDDIDTKPYQPTSSLGELRSGNSEISKTELGEKLYIKVKGDIDPNQLHESYSIGFRINPDKNYIDKLLNDIITKYNNIPLPPPLKWLKGAEDARRFAEVPFNLVETNIPATFLGLRDKFNNERFYYDNTRTIVAQRLSDTRVDWYALDLIRRGENQDTYLDDPEFDINIRGQRKQNIRPKKIFYVPLKEGGYRRTDQAGDAVLETGQYYPGTIVSYEYQNEKAGRNDVYYFRADLKNKKKYNVDNAYETEGGHVDLFTERVSDQALENGYLAYVENPYTVMRINRNFDMVSCFNDRIDAPVFQGSSGIFLDIHEDPSGDYLISRLNESLPGNKNPNYKLRPYLARNERYDGVYLNNGQMSEGQAMEELMKKIYFYGEEVKKEYVKEHNGKEMHRLIEASMFQRVIHHFTDGKSLADDYFQAPSDYNIDDWKIDVTLTGRRRPSPYNGWEGQFESHLPDRTSPDGARKLKDNEERIKNSPPVQRTQYDLANKLYNKIIKSYGNGSDWNSDKADSVKVVFYSHTREGDYQELITGRVIEPIEIDKFKKDGTKLEGAEFRFTNINTGQSKTWTSKADDQSHKLYLRPGTYRVQEITTPKGYEKIKDFNITVTRKEINGDDGPYRFKKLPKIHVNDGFVTEVSLGQDVPKSPDNKDLVKITGKNIKVEVTNVEDNLGKLEFVKKNKFAKLNGAEFTLRKVTATSLEDLKNQIKDPATIKYDKTYNHKSQGYYGEFKFEQIPAGYYVLEETKTPDGYQKAPLYLLEAKEQEDAQGKNRVVLNFVGDEKPETQSKPIVIRNEAKSTEIKFRKVRKEHVIDTDTEHLGLNDAKFRLMSLNLIDGDFYLKEAYTDRTKPSTDIVDGQNARGGGYIKFDDLKIGEYLLQELQPPKGYAMTTLYGWKLVVREIKEGENKGKLEYKLYEVPKESDLYKQNLEEIPLDKIINGDDKVEAFQIGNEARKISIPFDKYLSDGKTPPRKDGKPNIPKADKLLVDDAGNPVSFDLYKADYYGTIVSDKPINKYPIVQNKAKGADNPRLFKGAEYDFSFELHDLEFGGYYVLKEKNPPKGYYKAGKIVLKVEAEAIATEGKMKVIVRDPSNNAMTDGNHSIFEGVIDYEKTAKLGQFSIKKVGNAIPPYNGLVGLRRAYFRLYTADDNFNILYKDPGKKYPKEYIQKVTPGVAITQDKKDPNGEIVKDENGRPVQEGRDPKTLPKDQGIITFDQLKPGKYILEEYRGPAGYEKDPGRWYITVDNEGVVKKYRQKPGTGTREALYSMQSPRYKMSGLDISEKLPINRLLAPSVEEDLQDIEYDSSTDDLNIKVKASKVDTTNGKRTINFLITPKEKEVPGKKIQMVFLVERSKDSATTAAGQRIANGRTLDKNINYAITQIAKKAEETGTQVDVSFIEYSDRTTALKTTNSSLNKISKDLQDVNYENMYFDGEGEKANQTYKDFLENANISSRSNSNNDGSQKLLDSIDSYLTSISKDGYDKKIMIDFANFHLESVKRYGAVNGQFKFKKADLVNKFKDGGFETFVVHTDQKTFRLADGYQSQYAYTVMPQLKYFEYFNNSGSPGRNSASYYVYKNMVNEVLNNDGFVNNSDGLLVKDGKLDIGLRPLINLLSTSAKIGTNDISNNIVKDSTNNTISLGGINLKKGESLDFSYTIDLKEGTEFGKNYPINKSDIDKGVKFTNNGKENLIKSTYPKSNGELYTKKIKETPAPNTYKVTINPSENGSVSASKSTNIKKDEEITLTVTPSDGFRLKELKVTDANGKDIPLNGNKFTMPASNVKVDAIFEEDVVAPQGKVDLKTVFTYSNQKDGLDDSIPPTTGKAGTIQLYVKDENPAMTESWKIASTVKDAPYKGEVTFENLDPNRTYKLEYIRDEGNETKWGTETTSEIKVDLSNPEKREGQNPLKTIKIANGNLTEIFNKDESGFRIPLRITKVNENKGALTGSQFRARKILNGDKSLYKDILVDGKPSGKYQKSDKVAEDFPLYHNEKFDAVSEATGEPGDNYFRELTPGIYELTEIKAPDGTYRIPLDDNGEPMKWYFQVFVYEGRNPKGADYMGINFYFEHTFSENDDWNKDYPLTEAEKKALIGKTIKGLGTEDSKFNKYIQVIPDDGRSNPARPDAPYKGINDAQVTNYRSKTTLSFLKKDEETHQNINGAEFSLRKVQTETSVQDGKKVEKVKVDSNNKPLYEPEKTMGENGKPLTEAQKEAERVQPYDKDLGFAKDISDDKLGVEFTNIEQGTYILEEIKPANGYKPRDSFLTITFTSSEDGSWKQIVKAYEKGPDGKYIEMLKPNIDINKEGQFVSVYNKKNYIDLKFQKIKAEKDKEGNDIPVNTSTFKLTQVDKNGKPLANAKTWQAQEHFSNSNFIFKDLGVGRYKLEETKAIDQFEKPDPWYFNVVQDPKTYKLKIVFEKPNGEVYKSIGFTPDADGNPKLDDQGNPLDIKVKNYTKIDVSLQKLSSETDKETGKKLPLKDALFGIKKVRYSMDENSKSYEYYKYEKDKLKKYTNGNRITEFYESGAVKKFTLNGKVYEFDEQRNLTKVDGQAPSEADKADIANDRVKPDSVSSATGRYATTTRSQSDGEIKFENLSEGIYEVEEIKIPEGYQGTNKQFRWIFEVKKTKNGLVVEHDAAREKAYYEKYDKKYYDDNYSKYNFEKNHNVEESTDNKFSYNITNTKTTFDLKWKKVKNRSKTDPIKSKTKFSLYKASHDPNDVKKALSGDGIPGYLPHDVESTDGTFSVEGLTKGVYVLYEEIAPDGYEKMKRLIVIQIYEDEKDGYKLKQKFYELEYDKKQGKNTLIEVNDFEYLLTKGRTGAREADVDKDGTFYVNNESKPYFFYLSKGFMDSGKFKDITDGELRIKIYADPADKTNTDKKVYEQTIKLSDAKSYKINVDGVQLGKDYLLEEVDSPDGYAKTKYKYRLRFAYDASWDTPFVATLVAVLDENGEPLQNSNGKNITDSGQLLGSGQSINPGFQFRIVNKKTEMEFTKVGKEGDKETPLKDVEFYLEKQDPNDAKYYPLTENGEFIKSQTNRKGDGLDYYIERIVDGKVEKLFAINFKLVTIDGFAKKYHSDADGKFKITDLKDGYYRIIEPKAAKDANGEEYMKVNGPVKRFRVVDGVVRIISKDEKTGKFVEKEVNDENAKDLGKIINQKSGFGEFKLNKYDDNENPMANVEFDLVSADADERVVQSGKTDAKGQIHFKNLPYGYYWLIEKKTVDGYIVDTKKKFISLGGDKKWNVPEKNTDVSSSILFDGVQPDLVSTSGDKNTVYPNKEEAVVARFKLKFADPSKIAPGNHFTIKLTEDVDIDGIVKDNNGEGKSDTSFLNIIGPAGVLAKAEVDKNRRTITYTFTDYVKDYTPIDMNLFLQLYPNRYKLTHSQQLNLTADIGENKNTTDTSKHFEKSIYIDYRSQEGYQNPNIDVSSYTLRLEPDGKTFTAVIYYNQWNRLLDDKNIEFLTDKKIDTDSLSVKTYKKVDPTTGEREEGSHANGWQQGDLPDSYGIDPQKDHLELIGQKKIIARKTLYNLFGNNGWKEYDSISIPKGYLNSGWYIDNTINNKVNNDKMSTTYVVEIKGKLADSVTDPKSFKTHVQYNHERNWYQTYYDYLGRPYQRLVGQYYDGAFKTWSQFYTPGASGSAEKQMQLINFKNRIDFVKVDGGVKGEVADTVPDEDGNTHPSSIFTNENLGNALKGAKFKLKKDRATDYLANSEVESDENGRFSWIGLAPGHYEVWETQAPEGYKLPKDKVAAFTVDDKGNINLDVAYKEIVENYKTAKIKIRKVDQDGNPIDGIKEGKSAGFTLEGNKVKGWQSPTKYTGTDGYAVFEDVPFGNFELKETQIPQGYKKSDKTWKLSVSRDGRIAWTNSFDDTKDQLKEITYTSTGTKSTNLDTKIVAIDKGKKVFRQYNLIKANIDDLKNNKIKISSPDTTIKLNQDNTKIRLVALDKNSNLDNPTPTKDDAEYLVEYNNNSMDVSIKLPEEKKINGPVGSAPGEEDNKQKTYLLIVDLPYTENSKVGASLGYKDEKVDKLVENDKAITEKTTNQNLDKFKEFYRLRLVTDLDFVIENIKNPDIYFKKVDANKPDKALAGAEFEIQRKINEDGKEIYRALDTNGNVLLNGGTKWTARSDENGNFAFENIPIDGEYQIEETKAPEGYALVEKIVFKFVVKNGKIYYIDGQQNNNTKIDLKKDEEIKNNTAENRILVTNKKAQYPSTGGPGVWIGYTILGLIIMFVAVLTYSKRKDKLIV